jgi:hypothetical protein
MRESGRTEAEFTVISGRSASDEPWMIGREWWSLYSLKRRSRGRIGFPLFSGERDVCVRRY